MIGLQEMLDFYGLNGVGWSVLNDVLMGEILLFLGKFEERLILLGFEGFFG